MKKTIALSSLSLILVMSACGGNENNVQENEEFNNNADYVDNNLNEEAEEDPVELEEENDGDWYHEENNVENNTEENEEANGESTYDYGVTEFSLDLSTEDGTEIQYDYEVVNEDAEGEVEIEDENEETTEMEGTEGVNEIEEMLETIEITPDTPEEDAAAQIFAFLGVEEADVTEMELEIEFSDGASLEVSR